MIIRKSTFNIENILLIIFAFVYLITDLVQMPALIGNMLVALVGIGSFAYVIVKKGGNRWPINIVILYAIALSFCMILSILFNGNANITNIFWIWGYAGIALVLWMYSFSTKLLYGIFYTVSFVFLMYAIKGISPQQVFVSESGNNISTVVMYFMLMAYWKGYKKGKALPYIPGMIFVLLSLWGNGRAGLLTSLLFLGMIFIYNFLYIKRGKIKTLAIIIGLMIVGMYILQHYFGDIILQYQYKMQRYGMTSVRTEIWKEYINGACSNLGNFIFGVPTRDNLYPKLNYYGGNTHNAFLMLHCKFGIVGFTIFFQKIMCAVILALKSKDYIFVIIVVAIVFRSFFDWTAFPGIFDVYFWIILIYATKKKGESMVYGKQINSQT